MTLKSVKVPEVFSPLFEKAEQFVSEYFNRMNQDPTQGTITIGDERYVLVRAESLSVHFLEFVKGMYPAMNEIEAMAGTGTVLFDLAHSIGKGDARAFFKKLDVADPIARLSAGPIHFAYTGWAFVDILPQSKAVPNDEYYLLYDHPFSFEADSWIQKKVKTDFCICFMNAGYSSGWCSESFGLELTAKEIMCRARGDNACRFIMAPQNRIDEYVENYLAGISAVEGQ